MMGQALASNRVTVHELKGPFSLTTFFVWRMQMSGLAAEANFSLAPLDSFIARGFTVGYF